MDLLPIVHMIDCLGAVAASERYSARVVDRHYNKCPLNVRSRRRHMYCLVVEHVDAANEMMAVVGRLQAPPLIVILLPAIT